MKSRSTLTLRAGRDRRRSWRRTNRPRFQIRYKSELDQSRLDQRINHARLTVGGQNFKRRSTTPVKVFFFLQQSTGFRGLAFTPLPQGRARQLLCNFRWRRCRSESVRLFSAFYPPETRRRLSVFVFFTTPLATRHDSEIAATDAGGGTARERRGRRRLEMETRGRSRGGRRDGSRGRRRGLRRGRCRHEPVTSSVRRARKTTPAHAGGPSAGRRTNRDRFAKEQMTLPTCHFRPSNGHQSWETMAKKKTVDEQRKEPRPERTIADACSAGHDDENSPRRSNERRRRL